MNRTTATLVLLALSLVAMPQLVLCQIANAPALGPQSKHTFDLTVHYHYSIMDFATPHSPEEFLSDPKTAGQPERALGELFAAAKDHKYALWLSKWDVLSQQRLAEEMSASGMTQAQFLTDRSRRFEGASVVQVASRAPYVFFILRGGTQGDFAIAFKPSDTGWHATTEVDWEAQELAGPNH